MNNFLDKRKDVELELAKLQQQIEEIDRVINDYEQLRGVNWCGSSVSRATRLMRLIGDYTRDKANATDALVNFRQDVQVYLRAIALTIESAANAATHKEKDARLRGAVALIESGIEKLRDSFRHFAMGCDKPDLFRSDFPVRRYVDRIRELEKEVELLKGGKPENKPEPDFDEIPL